MLLVQYRVRYCRCCRKQTSRTGLDSICFLDHPRVNGKLYIKNTNIYGTGTGINLYGTYRYFFTTVFEPEPVKI